MKKGKMTLAIMKKTIGFKFGQELVEGQEVEVTQDNEDGSCLVRKFKSKKPLEFLVSRKSLNFDIDLLKKFAVVLSWDTEGDTGESPVLVGVWAKDETKALYAAVKQAENGTLYPKLYTGESKTPMVVNVEKSFACEPSKLTMITSRT
jgi:hypothetical protein